MKKGLNYETYEEAVRNYTSDEKWTVFDGKPDKFNITHECIDRHVDKGAAIRVKFAEGSKESYAFSELSRASSKFANLSERLGVQKGERVAIILEPCLEFYVSLFGSLKRGTAAVVCSSLFGSEAIRYRLEDSKAKLVITDKEGKELVKTKYAEHIIVKEDLLDLVRQEKDRYEPSTSVDDVAMIQYTSGTTGPPKPILYRHKSAVSLAPVARFAYGIKEGDSFFCPSPVAWGHGIWGGTCAPLMFGVPTGTRSGKFEPERLLEALEEFKVNNMTISPTACRKILTVPDFEKYDIKLQKMSYTGEPMDLDTFLLIKEKFGLDPCGLYGSTEVGVIIAHFAGFKDWKVKPGSLGKPMLGLEVAVIDENSNPLQANIIGDLAVKLRDKWVRIGDSGLMDEDGYFWYKGRSDDVIKSSGYRIGPEEVEKVVNMHEAVLESAVVGVPDKVRGQIVKAFIKLKPGYESSDELKEKIQKLAKEKLSKYAYPREISFIDEIPKTMDGKIKRKQLRMKELEKINPRS